MRKKINKEFLPAPADYFRKQKLKLTGGLEWKTAHCPFHTDDKPSLRVRIDCGAFVCHACGAKGGGIIAFHMRLHNLCFKRAAQDLGAWR